MSEDQMKQQLVIDQKAVKETLQQMLTSDQGKKFWESALKDPKFAESFAKGLQAEHEKMMKALMKDPDYQALMIDILKDPEMEKAMVDVLKSKEFRQHLQKVITETLNSPLYQAKIQDMLMKAAEKVQQGGEKQEEGGGEGGEGEESTGNQQGGGG